MTRPGIRSMRALPMLEARRSVLEKCVFCPKLCRSACPVSNAEPRETITPWGKMSHSWLAAHGDVALDAAHAAPAWACTGCYRCREWCDHRNPVAPTLLESRDALMRTRPEVVPPGAMRAVRGFDAHETSTRDAARALAGRIESVRSDAKEALLVGCGYLRRAPREAAHAIEAMLALSRRPVALVQGCCGLPLVLAGDAERYARHVGAFVASLASYERVTVVDPGCALSLRDRLGERLELLIDRAARALSWMSRASAGADSVRWHDPCQLGRGMGVYDAPRAVLGRVLGRAPDEFHERRENAACSGAGGLLPCTMPANSRAIGDARMTAHLEAGGGRIVTGCASSLVALRKAGAARGVLVDDVVTWLARGLGVAAHGA
ncbi:MAG TPA: (Fe-S)-binding protein [Polyangiaceae bacterium]